MSLREDFIRFDDALVAKGVPPCTAWWREHIGAWLDAYEHRRVLELWGAVGRGAAKSTALYKLALFFTLFGRFEVPEGERHFAIVLSRLKEEAAKGIAIIARWMTLLGVKHRVAGDVLELARVPRGIRVVAASVAATSGWRAYAVLKDERSKWAAGGVDDLDGAEIDTSAAAMTATHPDAPVVSFGSAWGAFGTFHAAIVSGTDTTKHVVGPTPTWIAAPHITKEDTQRKERDPRKWAREYACEFQRGSGSAFDEDDVAVIDRPIEGLFVPVGEAVLPFDSAAGSGDSWTWGKAQFCAPVVEGHDCWLWAEIAPDGSCEAPPGYQLGHSVVHYGSGAFRPVHDEAGRQVPNPRVDVAPRLVVSSIHGLTGHFARRHTAEDVVAMMARTARATPSARHAFGDPYQGYFMSGALAKHQVAFHPLTWTNESKTRAVSTLRRWLRDRRLVVEAGPEADALKMELLAFEEKYAPSGALTYGARRAAHDDRVALLLNLAMASNDRLLPGDPYGLERRRYELNDDGSAGFQGALVYVDEDDDC